MKKIIGIAAAAVIVLGLSLVIYNQIIPDEYVPADDEIALHLKLDTEEDVGLLVYDYRAGGREYSGGISNADGSLIQHDSDNIVVWNREELNLSSDTFELSMQFRIRMTSQSIWSQSRGRHTLVNPIALPSPGIRQMDIRLY